MKLIIFWKMDFSKFRVS